MKLNRLLLVSLMMSTLAYGADRVLYELRVLEEDLCFACGVYAVGDIDDDGLNDIVAGGSSPDLWWARYPDVETKIPIAENAGLGNEIHLADVDNDGDIDVMSSSGGLTWWENPLLPDGNLSTSPWAEHESPGRNGASHDFRVGDIDGDGKVDAVERNKERPWTFYIQETPTTFHTFTLDAATKKEGTTLADIDDDGDLDITDGVAWFECPEDPAVDTWEQHDLGPNHNMTRVAVGDLTGDNIPDIVVAPAEFGGNRTLWYEAPEDPRTGTWTEHMLYERSDPNFHTLQIGDMDGDGTNDIVLGTTAYHDAPWGRRITILYNVNGDGSGLEEQSWESPKGAWQGVVADVGSDGDLDILTANYEGGQFEFWESMLDPTSVAAGPESFRRNVRAAPARSVMAGRWYTIHGRVVTSRSTQSLPDRSAGPARVLFLSGNTAGLVVSASR